MAFDISDTVELARWWWTFILRGILAIIFGILAFFAPLLGIAILVGLFGGVGAHRRRDGHRGPGSARATATGTGGWRSSRGSRSIVAGVIALIFPEFAARRS